MIDIKNTVEFKPNIDIEGLKILKPQVFEDDRGFFIESFNKARFLEATGLDNIDFIQDNHSCSKPGVLRGLHYQSSPGQAKLIRCTKGRIWDVAVDIRKDSKTYGQWFGLELSAKNGLQLFIPNDANHDFAHGFCVLGDKEAEVQYKVTSYYNGDTEKTLAYNDPTINIKWPIDNPLVSDRDKEGSAFKSL